MVYFPAPFRCAQRLRCGRESAPKAFGLDHACILLAFPPPRCKKSPHTFATSLANHHPCASQKLRYFLPPTYRRIGECAGLLNDISFNVNVARRTVIL